MNASSLRAILAHEGLVAAGMGLKKLKLSDSRGVFFIEVTPQQAAALKMVPGGSNFEIDRQAGKIFGASWSKRGGYADVIEKKFHAQLRALGFHLVNETSDAHPADFYTASSGTYKDAEGTIAYSASTYGQTKSGNSFTLSVHFKRPVRILGDEADAEHAGEFAQHAPGRNALEVLKKTSWIEDPRVDRSGRAVGLIKRSEIPPWARDYFFSGIVSTSGGALTWALNLKRTFTWKSYLYGKLSDPYWGKTKHEMNFGGQPGWSDYGKSLSEEELSAGLSKVLEKIHEIAPDRRWLHLEEKEKEGGPPQDDK